ncbi:unnamed protein product [Nippostrongylus brasiliensis]|uniref:THO complex subunit 5 homolog (inferred by orthology to a human protein) n=1 Tax=Nippostrongylus brasiliensis TaxID=27835 RepID=A0A0N4Y0S8_NIPBR|nr:unnamed protein product [Nippostrongylus brasiliensis]
MTLKRTSAVVDKPPVVSTRRPKVEATPLIEPSDLYQMEDEIARSTTHAELEKQFLRESTKLRSFLQQIIDDDHDEVEAKYIHLQNSSSEIQHLQKEIGRCLQFSAGDEDIDLVPIEDFYANAPEGVSRPEVTRANEHEQRLARLTWEIAQRKALIDTLTEQEGRRNVLISSISGKEHRLKGLRSKISALIAAAKPVQEALGVGNVSSSSAEQRALFSLLPHDLSVLYVQAEAYRDIMEDTGLQVVIRGDANEAVRLNRQQKDDADEKERSDDDDASDNEERHSVVSDRLEVNKRAVTQPHPIYLKIDIACQDEVKVSLKLFYMTELRVTCMKYKITGKLPTHGGISAHENLLDSLFPGDDGTECPNPIGAAKLSQLRIGVETFASKCGRPYRFVQALTGSTSSPISAQSKVDSSGVQLADALHDVVKAIRDRVCSRMKLARELIDLEASPMEAVQSGDVPLKVVTQITSFKMIDEETFLSSVTPDLRKLASEENGAFYYLATLVNRVADLKIQGYVMIPVNYPKQIPLFGLVVTQGGGKDAPPRTLSSASSHIIKSLERYINISCVTEDHVHTRSLLARQLAHLASRCDLIADLVPSFNPGNSSHRQHLYSRLSRVPIVMQLISCIILLQLKFAVIGAQTWMTGDNSTVDVDQWHRRHGKPQGQDMDLVAAEIKASFLAELHPKDLITNETATIVAQVLSDRIRNVLFCVIQLLFRCVMSVGSV